jgi:hypothetical protein
MSSDFHAENWQRAKKPHSCCVLRRGKPTKYGWHTKHCTIRPGQWYATASGVHDGYFYTFRLCRTHLAMCHAMFDYFDYYRDEGLDYTRAVEELVEAIDCQPKVYLEFVKAWLAAFRECQPSRTVRRRKPRKAAKCEALRTSPPVCIGAKP